MIRKDHLRFWNISPTQLFDAAKENTPRLLSYDLRNMNDLMEELLAPAHSTLSDPGYKKRGCRDLSDVCSDEPEQIKRRKLHPL